MATVIGPVINEAAAQRSMGVIDRAKAESGGRLVTGGRRGQGDLAAGSFVEPTVFAGVAHDSHLAREEVFGPVLRSEEHTSELQSLMRISYAVFCLKKKKRKETMNKHRLTVYTIELESR